MRNRDMTEIVTVRRLPFVGALFFASIAAAATSERDWIGAPAVVVMMISGIMFLTAGWGHFVRYVYANHPRVIRVASGLSDAAGRFFEVAGDAAAGIAGIARALFAMLVGLLIMAFILGGLIGLLLIGWRALTS